MRDHFCTPKALLEALKKSTLEGEEPDSTIISLAGKPATKTGGKKKDLGDLQAQIYAKQAEIDNLTKVKEYVEAPASKPMFNANDAKTAQDYIDAIKKKQADKKLLSPEEKELLKLNGKLTGIKVQIANALSDTKKTTPEQRRFDFEADAKRRVKLSDQTQKKLEVLQAGGKELTDAEVYRSLLFDARSKNDAERLKEVRKEVKDLKAEQTKVLNEKKDALLEKLKSDPASITNEELSILETNAEKKVRLDMEKAQREAEVLAKKIENQKNALKIKNQLLEDLKAGKSAGYLKDLQKKRFDAILNKENKTDLEKQLLKISKDLTKEKAKISQKHANVVFDALSNKKNLTKDEQTVLDAIVSKRQNELTKKLDTYTNLETTQKKRLEALNKPLKKNPAEIEAQEERMKPIRKDLENIFTDNYKRVSKADAEANGKQALVEAYKKGKFTDAEAEQLATNQHAINMRRITVNDARLNEQVKNLNKLLEEKTPLPKRARQTIIDKLTMVARQAEDGTLDDEAFGKLAKKVLKDQLTVSDAGVPHYVEIELRKLSKQIDELEASDKPLEVKYDEKALLHAKINAELSGLIKPTVADKINANIYLEPLLTVGSAVRDVLGSTNAVLSEAYLNKMTRLWLGKDTVNFDFKREAIGEGFQKLAKNATVEWERIGDNWKRAGEYARQGLVVVSHDKVASSKIKPLFAYENKGFGSVKDGIESVGHWFEVAGNFRLNATDMYFMDTTFKHHIAQTIADGLKENPNFKISKEQVEQAHQYANWMMFKEDNFLTNNVASVKQFLNNLGGLPFEVQGKQASIPLGDLLMRYTRTPINVGLRVFDMTGLGDLRFMFAKGEVPIYDRKALKPFVKSGENYTPKEVKERATKGMVKLLTTGVSGLAIAYGLGNTDVFSTGYTKENSDVEEAKGTRNDVYFNPMALTRWQNGFKEDKGDLLIPLTPLLGQHVVGLRAAIRFAKGKDLTEGEKSGLGQAVDAIATTFDVATSHLTDSTGLTGIKQAFQTPDAFAGAFVERVPKPFLVGSLGRDAVTIFDDKENVTKDTNAFQTGVNRLLNGSVGRNLLKPKTDITGDNPKSNGIGKALGFPFKIAKADPVIKELRKVSRESGVDVQLTQVDRRFEIGKTLAQDYGTEPQNMKLNAQDFAKWQEIHNNMVYQSVKTVLESEDYKSLTDPLDRADEIKNAKENPFVEIDGKDYTPKELFLEYKLKGRVVNINK